MTNDEFTAHEVQRVNDHVRRVFADELNIELNLIGVETNADDEIIVEYLDENDQLVRYVADLDEPEQDEELWFVRDQHQDDGNDIVSIDLPR